jgi:hypothetical protein
MNSKRALRCGRRSDGVGEDLIGLATMPDLIETCDSEHVFLGDRDPIGLFLAAFRFSLLALMLRSLARISNGSITVYHSAVVKTFPLCG